MANPTPYSRAYGFANFQATHPSDPLPGNEVDAELDSIAAVTTSHASAIEDVRRSDGALKNGIVTVDTLDSAMALALNQVAGLDLATAAVAAAASAATASAGAATATTQAGIASAAAATLTGANACRTVRVASTADATVSNPGTAVFDGITLANGDRVLLKNQSVGSQNGIYDFNGSGSAMTRSTDSDISAEMPSGLLLSVDDGTLNGGSVWRLGTHKPITLGATSLSFSRITNQDVGMTATPSFSKVSINGGTLTSTDVLGVVGSINCSLGIYFANGNGCQWGASNFISGSAAANTITATAGGSGGVVLSGGASAWAAVSDERLKSPLTPFVNALAKVSSLAAGTGHYLTDDAGLSRSFLTAQSVQAVLPEAVSEGEDGYLHLRYTEVIPLLVAAIQELKARVEALEAK